MTRRRLPRFERSPSGLLVPSRRGLLTGLAGLGGLAAFGGASPFVTRARAADAELEDRYFIFCYFSGGWDLQMCLDPKDPSEFRDDLRKITRIQPGWDQLSSEYQEMVETSVDGMVFGPAIGDIARHADKLSVIRGMSMDTLTHEVGRRRFLTGHAPVGLQAKGSSLATVLASHLGADQPMPQLSVLVESYNTDQPSWSSAIRVSSVGDLVRALQPSPRTLSPELQGLADRLLEEQEQCDAFKSTFHRESMDFRRAAQNLVDQGLDARFDFGSDSTEMEALRDLYDIDPEDLASAPAQAAAAVTAITAGISRCVSIVVADDLDSHGPEWSSAHAPRIASGFDLMAAIIDDLEGREFGDTGESWLDRTMVIGFSEFGRSPLLNSSGGRDHYLHNAAVLAGGGVRGGSLVGQSSDVGMAPTPTDLLTGQRDEGGVTVRPEHLFRAILQSVGIQEDVVEYGVDPLSAVFS